MQKIITLAALLFCLSLTPRAEAYECKVCHSKNPHMVAMHQALQGRNCFECHRIGDKLMGKGQPKDLDSLLKRRASEAVCLPCHGGKAATPLPPS